MMEWLTIISPLHSTRSYDYCPDITRGEAVMGVILTISPDYQLVLPSSQQLSVYSTRHVATFAAHFRLCRKWISVLACNSDKGITY